MSSQNVYIMRDVNLIYNRRLPSTKSGKVFLLMTRVVFRCDMFCELKYKINLCSSIPYWYSNRKRYEKLSAVDK